MLIRLSDGSLLNLGDDWHSIELLPTEEPPEEILAEDDAALDEWIASRDGDTMLLLIREGADAMPLYKGPYDMCLAITRGIFEGVSIDLGPQPMPERKVPSPTPEPRPATAPTVRTFADRMYAGTDAAE